MALSGVGITVFTIVHLLENLSIYVDHGAGLNYYGAWLHSYDPIVKVLEIGLFALFILHFVMGFFLKGTNLSARPNSYKKHQGKSGKVHTVQGDTMPSAVSARNMIISGIALLAFLVLHLSQFRFGPGIEQGYVTFLNGKPALDLFRMVRETFSNPIFVGVYVLAMGFLWLHLRHGFWSAFQSLGATNPRISAPIYLAGRIIATLLAVGFLALPLWVYFTTRGAALGGLQ